MKRFEVWLAELPYTPGSHVQAGRRPVVVVSQSAERDEELLVTIIPLTTKYRRLDLKTHVLIMSHGLRQASMAKCEQIMTVDKRILLNRVGFIDSRHERNAICHAMSTQLGLAA